MRGRALLLLAPTMALVLALVVGCGGGGGQPQQEPAEQRERNPQPQQEQEQKAEATKRQGEGPTQKEQPSQGEQPRQQDALERPAQKKTAIIEITGNAPYLCTVGLIDSSRTVEGRAPATYKLKVVPGGTSLDTVMAVCQQTGAGGPLGVRILYDGELKAQEQTNARLGTVAVSWSPVEG